MFWIVDRAPRDEDTDPLLWIATGRHPGRDDMARLMAALSAQGVPHQAVRKPPFSDYLVDMVDKDKRVELRPDGLVFAYGSTTLHEVSNFFVDKGTGLAGLAISAFVAFMNTLIIFSGKTKQEYDGGDNGSPPR